MCIKDRYLYLIGLLFSPMREETSLDLQTVTRGDHNRSLALDEHKYQNGCGCHSPVEPLRRSTLYFSAELL